MAKRKRELHPLDALAEGDPRDVIALMLWKNRMREPDMYVQLTEQDMQGLADCTNYQKVTPHVNIERPEGAPAQAAIPASGNRRAVPARPALPPKPYVIVTLVDQDGNMVRPIENNQADYDASLDAALLRKARDQAPDLAQRLIQQAKTGETSLSDMQDAADALILLARAV
jgi:hypothetical protein